MAAKRDHLRKRWVLELSESTARGLCRLAFVVFGLAPLLICTGLSGWHFLPTYQRSQTRHWEQLLGAAMGIRVHIGAFEAASPERFSLHTVRFNHPETGNAIGRVSEIGFRKTNGKWLIQAEKVNVEARQLTAVWKILHDWSLCRPRADFQGLDIRAQQLVISASEGDQFFRDFQIQMISDVKATAVSVLFAAEEPPRRPEQKSREIVREEGAAQTRRSQLTIRREHQRERLRTTLQLRTGETALPCSLVFGTTPAMERFGDLARFAGVFEIEFQRTGWQATLTDAYFTNVDCGQLCLGTGLVLNGEIDVRFENLLLTDKEIVSGRARGVVRSGQMAQPVFAALGSHLGFELRSMNPVTSYGFDLVDFAVDLQPARLLLWSQMFDKQGLLARREAWESPIALPSLVSALAASTPEPNRPSGSNVFTALDGSRATDEKNLIEAYVPNDVAAVSASWLSKQALQWLPFRDESQRAHDVRLSQTQPSVDQR